MDLLSFLRTKQAVGGLAVSDGALRLALLERQNTKAGTTVKARILSEEVLLPGEIAGGSVKDEARFSATLKKLIDGTGIKYVVLSLPADAAFAKTYQFPPDITDAKLKSSLELITHFQLPLPPDRIYADWQKLGPGESLLAFADMAIVDQLLRLIQRLGLTAVAVECQSLSLARAFDQTQTAAWLAVTPGESGTCFSVISRAGLRLLHCSDKAADQAVEAKKTAAAYEYQHEPIGQICLVDDFNAAGKAAWPLPLKPFPLAAELKPLLGDKNPNDWAAALGAAWRGLLPRAQDRDISLMKIGTEEAYRRQTAVAFTNFLSSLTIGLALLLSGAFLGAWLIMISLQQNFNQQIDAYQNNSQGAVLTDLENRAGRFNSLVGPLGQIVQKSPDWVPLLTDLSLRLSPGITLTGFNAPGPDQTISLLGNARTRQDLNDFKKSLAGAPMAAAVNLPLDNLGKKNDIPFSLTLTLKPGAVMPKQPLP